jgi:PAS domain S-box-containing protein
MRILLIEDNPGDARLIREVLRDDATMELVVATTLGEALRLCGTETFDAALVDLGLPDSSGLGTVMRLQEHAPHLAVVVFTGSDDDQLALDAAKVGAQDYLVKGRVGLDLLRRSLRYAIERKRIEMDLRESRQRYQQIVETAQEGIWAVDAQGVTTYANPRMAEMLGCQAQEMTGRSFLDFMDEDKRPIAQANLERRRSNITEEHEFEFLRRDGKHIQTLVSTSPIKNDAGAFAGALAVVMDLTERKNIEQQLLQVQKLESVGRLAGGIAHDFNNILSVIMGYSEIALLRMGEDSPARASLEGVNSAVQRAAALTGQLLIFSRKQVAQPRVVNLNEVIRGFQKMLERLIGEDIRIETRLPERLWSTRVDPHQMEQVLMNLAVNARDAMPKGGALLFETLNLNAADAGCEPHRLSPCDYVLLKVADSGCGVPAEAKAHIFDPFFTTKGVGKGTGLGLSVVYGVIKQARGTIRFESAEGAGTSFWIYLPRESAEPKALCPAELDVRTIRGTETIVLVDDEASICEIVRMTLEEHGYQVFATTDPAQALNWVTNTPTVDVLVTDVVMPDMSGTELAQRAIALRPQMRVLLMSGYAAEESGVSVLEKANPAWGRIEKPFGPQALTAAIRGLLDGTAGAKTGSAAEGLRCGQREGSL